MGPSILKLLQNTKTRNFLVFTHSATRKAYFALAKYVEAQIGKYPAQPRIGRSRPNVLPRDSKIGEEPALAQGESSPPESSNDDDDAGSDDGSDDSDPPPPPGTYPGCSDKIGPQVPKDEVILSLISECAAQPT